MQIINSLTVATGAPAGAGSITLVTNLTISLGEPLGNGSFGTVYKTYDPQLGCELAVKKIDKAKIKATNLFHEAQMTQATKHPHVVEIKYGCELADFIYIAMPIYKTSLAAVLKSKALTLGEIVRYTTHLLLGLQHAHSKGVLHCDIKPGNLLLTEQDTLVLSDFGCAKKMLLSGAAKLDHVYGLHQAPEQFPGSHGGAAVSTIKTDIYQVGVTLLRMLWGSEFENHNREATDSDVIAGKFPKRSVPAYIPDRMQRIVERCLMPNPDLRYDTVEELQKEISRLDKYLDWRPSVSGNVQKLTRNMEQTLTEICITADPVKTIVRVYKTGKSGRRYQQQQHARVCNSRTLVDQHLKDVLRAID